MATMNTWLIRKTGKGKHQFSYKAWTAELGWGKVTGNQRSATAIFPSKSIKGIIVLEPSQDMGNHTNVLAFRGDGIQIGLAQLNNTA